MHAALGEAWDSDFDQWRDGTSGPLARAFSDAFAADPEGSWALIQSGKFGVGASLLRDAWYQSIGESDVMVLSRKLGEIPPNEIAAALVMIREAQYAVSNAEQKSQMLDALLALPENLVSMADLIPFFDRSRPMEEVRSELAAVTDFDSRQAQVLIGRLAVRYMDAIRLADESGSTLISLKEDLAAMPKAAQGTLLLEALTNFGDNSYWGGAEAGKGTLKLLDLLIDGEHWDHLAEQEAVERLDIETRGLPSEDVAFWAASLPEREELAGLFQRGVDDYIRDNMELAWDWIGDFPPGLWRDRALAEYSQQAIGAHDDYEASRRALDAIADPEFRRIAEDRRPEKFREMDGE